jgi:hypothetical protein
MASPEFRTWWAEHDVATRNSGTKRYRHPVVGEMSRGGRFAIFRDMRPCQLRASLLTAAHHHPSRVLARWVETIRVTTKIQTRKMIGQTNCE